jgi:hypothetical protein
MKAETRGRRHDRIYARIPVTLQLDSDGQNESHETYTVDLSQRGLRVQTDFPLWPGQGVKVMPRKPAGPAITTKVVWVHASHSERSGQAGLLFLGPSWEYLKS